MARAKWCADDVYDVAMTFRDRCLIADDALLQPTTGIWTAGNVRAVADRVGVPDLGAGSFIEKLETQLGGLTDAQIEVGAEFLIMLLLPEVDTSGAKKREHLARILAMSGSGLELSAETSAALEGGGVASYAAGKSHRDAHLRFLGRLFVRVKDMAPDLRRATLTDPWALHALVSEVRTSTDGMQANAFLHLMFPEVFEYMIAASHRQKLIATFHAAPGVADEQDPDRKIARIRELASAGGDLDLYEDPFQKVWKNDAPPRWVEAVEWSRRLYAHEKFDDYERDYKFVIADRVAAAKDALLTGTDDWLRLLRRSFTAAPNNLTSFYAHGRFLDWCDANPAVAGQILGELWRGEGTGSTLHAFLQEIPREAIAGGGTRVSFASFLLMGLDVRRFPFFKPTVYTDLRALLGLEGAPDLEIDPEGMYRPEELASRLGLDGRRVRAYLREAFPRNDEARSSHWFLSPEQAQRVVDEFAPEADPGATAAIYADWVALLEELRLRMLAAGVQLRDLLDAQGIVWWLVRGDAPEGWSDVDRAAFAAFKQERAPEPGGDTAGDTPSGPHEIALPPVDADLAARVHLPVGWLQRVFALLEDKKQLILYGPPGTGKTFLAQHIGRHIGASGGAYRLVQFHPSYTYEDFFEGYRPKAGGDGGLNLELVPGTLRQLASSASDNPTVPHLLVVDEINRGNIAKIFGELYFLLEYRDEAIRLQYSDEDFRLPPNLFVIGTMNTADRSIALVDTALRRRFYFVGLLPTRAPVDQVLARWLAANDLPPEPADLLAALNRTIGDEDFSIGPSYFMSADGSPPDLERIWDHAIMPLLEEHYYGTDRDLEADFGLAAVRKGVAAAADETAGISDDDDRA